LIVAQPVVTAHMQSLQKRLGVKLMYRDGHRMRLTEGGERVYEWARETLSRTRELMRELDGLAEGERGSVAISASMTVGSYLLPSLLAGFRRQRPNVAITLSISDPESAAQLVERGESDFAVLVADAPPGSSALHAETIGEESIVLVAAPDFEPGLTSVPVAALEELPMVSSPAGHVRQSVIDRQLADRGVRLGNVAIELGHPEAMKRATLDSLGMCFLFDTSVARELENGELREVAITDCEMSVPLMTVVRANKRLSPIQLALLSFLTETLREVRTEEGGPT
jgi:DNA-binding transcriptional LysR family regulator